MKLSTEQMARLSRLLDEALTLDEAGRRRWLQRLSERDRDLEAALRHALLPQESGETNADQLDTLPKVGAAESRVSTLKPGDRVGPYRLERELGVGGMAEVWLAQRADGAFKREIALKIPSGLHQREDLKARFERERDILAALEHPGAGASTAPIQGTVPACINPSGVIAGYYVDTSGRSHGFVRDQRGTIRTFDVLGAGTAAGQGTFAYCNNPANAIAGYYVDAYGTSHGFLWPGEE